MPTSTTAVCTWREAKYRKPMAVRVSKKLGNAGSRPSRTRRRGDLLDMEEEGGKIVVADHGAIHLDALIDAAQVRRGVETGPVAGTGENAGQGRSG